MRLKVLTIATVSVCLITATVIAVGNSKVAFLGDQIVKANGEDITFYATSEAFYNGTPYSETMYFVRIVDPVYDYWNGSIIVNSTAFKIEFPLGYEKFVKLYSDGACLLNDRFTDEHIYTATFSSSSSSATFSPKIVEGCKYCLKVIFYKTTTSSTTKQTLDLVGYVLDSCDPDSYDFLQMAKYGNLTKGKINIVFT